MAHRRWYAIGHILAATFHPELSSDRRVHQYFLDMVRDSLAAER